MTSTCSGDFWEQYNNLDSKVRAAADKAFRLWMTNPSHPSLQFKKPNGCDFWCARITKDYRAVCVYQDDTYIWFFIGNHKEYDALIP